MRIKLIAAGVFVLFISMAWTYFQTPNPPVPGLVRPQIDDTLFSSSAAANPAAEAAKKRAEARKERLEQRKNLRSGDATKKEEDQEKPGFLNRLLGRSDSKAAAEPDDGDKPATRKAGSPSRMQRRDAGTGALSKAKRDQLAKRREERKARREAMAGGGARSNIIHKTGNAGNAGPGGNGDEEIPLPDEHLPPDEPQDFGVPDLQEDLPPDE